MDKEDIIALFEKYKKGECTPQEMQWLYDWIVEGKFDSEDLPSEELFAELQILEKNLPIKRSDRNKKLYRSLAMYAAGILAIIGLSFYIYQLNLKATSTDLMDMQITELAPGSNKAILQLEDGSSIVLDTLTQNKIVSLDGAQVRLNADGQLLYLERDATTPPRQNQIITPKGGQYEVVLMDGTRVWMNSDSRLSFTNSFDNQTERMVTLDGEAYFEVSKNKNKPFVVNVMGQRIQVLGTAFNVHAYASHGYIKTSLVEGSITFNQKQLVPGQSAIYENHRTTLYTDNMDDIIAWKNGYFVFFEETLEVAMQKLSRWYDIDVTFADENAKHILVGGSISKYENAAKVFEMIEKTGNVKIKTEGRKVIIHQI